MKVELMQILQKIMECNNINMKLLSENEFALEDIHPYRMLYSDQEYKQHLTAWIQSIKEGVFYCYRDTYEIFYCIGIIPALEHTVRESLSGGNPGRQFLMLGPFMEYAVEEKELISIMDSNHVPAQYKKELREFYNAVPIILQAERLIELCRQLFQLFYPEQTVHMEYLRHDFYDWEFRQENPDTELSAKIIEERYLIEEKVMSAIANGDVDAAMKCLSDGQKFRLSKRCSDSLRDIRNSLITTNTLWRKAAQTGGVHPVHIDRLSEKLAKNCEKVMTPEEAYGLRTEMLRQYCFLVRNYSLREYSPAIRGVVNHINIHLSEKLSLKQLAEQYFINPSYLSTCFKKEMGITISAYIIQQRIQLAVSLFNMGYTQIQEVAAKCGIDDTSYFRKLFKKAIGMTPSDYVHMVQGSGQPVR